MNIDVTRVLVAVAIFALTYALIAGRRLRWLALDRPMGVMLGAVLMVGAGIVTPETAYQTIHHGTLVLLFGMMVINIHLEHANFFQWASWQVLRRARSPAMLLHLTLWTAGGLSMLLVNDTVCLMLTPLVLLVWRGAGLSILPGCLALAMGSNLGSALTLTGNPQNMIVGQLSELSFVEYLAGVGASGGLALLAGGWVLQCCLRPYLVGGAFGSASDAPTVDRPLLNKTLGVLGGVSLGFLLGFDMAWTALTGAVVLVLLARLPSARVLAKVDWTLLLFFAGLFIVMGGLGEAGVIDLLTLVSAPLLDGGGNWPHLHLSWLSIVGSQLVSNVPWVLLAGDSIRTLPDADRLWMTLALASTYAGNLTILGSVANIIVLEGARGQLEVGFRTWLKYGVPVTLVSTVVGVLGMLVLS